MSRKTREVLGINARNLAVIYPRNPRKAFRSVDDKLICKEILSAAGVPVPATLFVVHGHRQLLALAELIDTLPGFVVKPARASGGKGILVVRRNGDGRLVSPGSRGDRVVTTADVLEHIAQILAGLVTPARLDETVFLEELLEPDGVLGAMAWRGLPDIRVIVDRGRPVMAMVRVPTAASAGRANLHQGALGLGVDMESGRTTLAILGNRKLTTHPDTGHPLEPVTVPHWETILAMSRKAGASVELGYVGVDLILDRNRGPLVIELNARPGLNIQLANGAGLRPLLGLDQS
ncbi:MAG: alpha-L-glutamate ligase-like protein [Acidobacteria bacterium]|uniref:Alpha-L-glutamate ligase-like protein n=1 Tax=Candidatus Polarisedimenticola svalbardensis TaxID=2886004 RepID=A0A8J7CMD9_9BACT|nr:alpha-L-glutamate ligase-like protein [Candidatus Polarisedimenticola svalbardensis]